MKRLHRTIGPLFLACWFLARPALADHMAIVYCAMDDKNSILVVAADANPTGEVWSSAKKGASCSQALHEIMSNGYEVYHVGAPWITQGTPPRGGDKGYLVFVLKKNAPHN